MIAGAWGKGSGESNELRVCFCKMERVLEIGHNDMNMLNTTELCT